MSVVVAPYMKSGMLLDTIVVEGIKVEARHGVHDAEKSKAQPFVVDVVVHLDSRIAARSDDLSRTVDYSEVAKIAAARLAGEPVNLIEAVADKIASAVLELGVSYAVDVIVHKPTADLGVKFDDVYVSIRRDLRKGDLGADKRIGSAAGLADDPQSPGAIPVPVDVLDERPTAPVSVLLAFGGNIGDVEFTLARAIEDLSRVAGITIKRVSPLVATKPVGGPPQPDFLDAVVRIETTLAARPLLHVCQGIEMIHGREREVENGPRTLDIDLVTYGDLNATSDDLSIPHPRAFERAFVLGPWAAMEPDAVLAAGPESRGGRVADLANAAPDVAGLVALRNPWDPAAVLAARMAGAPSVGA